MRERCSCAIRVEPCCAIVKERREGCCRWLLADQRKRCVVRKEGVHDEELKADNVGKADELVKGADVSVSEDADRVRAEDGSDSAEAVVDGAPSVKSGIKPERDTLGNASTREERPAVTAAGSTSAGGGGATTKAGSGSERTVDVLVTAPEPSM